MDDTIEWCRCECGEYFEGTSEDYYCAECWEDLNFDNWSNEGVI